MREGTYAPGTRAAVVVGTVSLSLTLLLVVGGALGWWPFANDAEGLSVLGVMVFFIALGTLILWKAGGNRIGWVFSAIGLSILLSGVAGALSDRGLIVGQAIGGGLWLSWIIGMGTLVLWFPTGRVPTPRWRWVEWFGFILIAITLLAYTFTEEICVDSADGCAAWVDNPIGIPGVPNPEYGDLSGPLFGLYAVFMVAVVVSLIVRFRRARGVERQQLKWFLLAGSSLVVAMVAQIVFEGITGAGEPPLWLDLWLQLSILAIPVTATLAILRYRLYEIDRIISRTVSYALVVVLLAMVFFGAVTVATSVLSDGSDLVVAGATLAVAALFNPLRKRVQVAVDRRFNRSRYDAQRVVDGFSVSLRDEVDADRVVSGWVGVVADTMQPASVAVWVRETR